MRSLASRLNRLERIEARASAFRRLVIQNGHMKTLPAEYKGERHVVTLSRVLDANEWFEWEERPGPAPVAEVATDVLLIRVCPVPSAHNKLDSEMDEEGPQRDLIAGGAS